MIGSDPDVGAATDGLWALASAMAQVAVADRNGMRESVHQGVCVAIRADGSIAHRVGDPNTGGTSQRPIVTAYRQDALRCLAVLAEQGPAKAADVAGASGVPRATAIMYRDVYGWFERVERGVYALSPKGQAARRTYAGVLAQLIEDRR